MKQVFVGTKLDEADHRAFKIKAAMSGKSSSALLKELALKTIQPKKAAVKKTQSV